MQSPTASSAVRALDDLDGRSPNPHVVAFVKAALRDLTRPAPRPPGNDLLTRHGSKFALCRSISDVAQVASRRRFCSPRVPTLLPAGSNLIEGLRMQADSHRADG